MSHDRPDRAARSLDEAIARIRDDGPFDPDVVDAFLVLVAAEELLSWAPTAVAEG